MSTKNKISSLESLCIDNVTRNIVGHGKLMKKYRSDNKVYMPYKILKFIFADAILEKLFEIFNQKRADKDLKRLQNLMFSSREPRNPEDWPCLEFLFNEHTTSLFPPLRCRYVPERNTTVVGSVAASQGRSFKKMKIEISEDVLSFITTECKNVRKVNEVFYFLTGRRLVETMPKFRNIQEVDLGSIDSDEVLKNILQTCFGVKKLSADGRSCISDEFLLSLCKHCPRSTEFTFCPEDGNCSKAGKFLERLHVNFSHTSGVGIACSLQHLPKLRNFANIPVKYDALRRFLPDITRGIVLLQNAAVASGRKPVDLELREIHFHRNLLPNDLRTILVSCPKLEIIELDLSVINTLVFAMSSYDNLKALHFFKSSNGSLNSSELKEMLTVRGEQIKTISFMHSREPLDLTYIDNILEFCTCLESFSVHHVQLSDKNYDHLKSMPPCCTNLQIISIELFEPDLFPPFCRDYFQDLLCNAINLKHLNVAWSFAEIEFPLIVENANFNSLETLSVCCTDTTRIPFAKLLSTAHSLRRITFSGSLHVKDFAFCKEHSKARKHKLEIVCE